MFKPTLLALSTLSLLITACGEDPTCGPEAGLVNTAEAAVGGETVTYADWRASPNNDCGELNGPISVTLEATQMGTNRGFTLCFPRPDKLSGSVDITNSELVQVIDVFADLPANCLVSLDRTKPGTGTIEFTGVCSDATDPAGFAMDMQFDIAVTISCDAGVSDERMAFSSAVAVTATVL